MTPLLGHLVSKREVQSISFLGSVHQVLQLQRQVVLVAVEVLAEENLLAEMAARQKGALLED